MADEIWDQQMRATDPDLNTLRESRPETRRVSYGALPSRPASGVTLNPQRLGPTPTLDDLEKAVAQTEAHLRKLQYLRSYFNDHPGIVNLLREPGFEEVSHVITVLRDLGYRV